MAEKLESLKNLFEHELKDLYSAESQVAEALPKFAEKSSHEELKSAFQEHLEQTKNQVKRIEEVCRELNVDPSGFTSRGIEGLIRQAEDLMQEEAEPVVMDAGLIAEAQRIEHYEIAGYGAVCTYCELLGYDDFKEKLGESMDEQKRMDSRMKDIAKRINSEALV